MATARRPTILLSCPFDRSPGSLHVLIAYADAVVAAGGVPLVAPVFTDPAVVAAALDRVEGVVLIGGPDYHPQEYGGRSQPEEQLLDPRRHTADLLLARQVLAADLPLLGICAGLQAMVIASGGGLIQDIPTDLPHALPHAGPPGQPPHHRIRVDPASRLAQVAGTELPPVNSYHHQAVDPQRPGALVATAWSDDGVIEAMERPGARFCLGVQWHPERMPDSALSRSLFGALVRGGSGD